VRRTMAMTMGIRTRAVRTRVRVMGVEGFYRGKDSRLARDELGLAH
jgi:hypothetical protein